MTALSIVQGASRKIGVARPDLLFGGTTDTLYELQEYLNDAAAMVAFDCGHDWTKLKTLGTLTGDGSALSFDMPTDYRRMLKKAALWPSATPYSPYAHYADTDDWLGMLSQAFPPITGGWTLIGDEIHIRVGGSTSPLATATTAQFYYISSYFAKTSAGVAQAAFTADDDTFRLDERVLKLALIYRWKQGHLQDYAEELSDYENALSERVGSDKGSNMFAVGGHRGSAFDVGAAYSGVLG
jgi:hypothetical protein